MNSYQNKKRKRNLVKKAKFKKSKAYSNFIWNKRFNKAIAEAQLNFAIDKLIPKAVDNLPKDILTEEQLEILKKRATN